jgi:hypothetical protein
MGAALDKGRLGGFGTNPECAVKSTDRFLTSLARIQVIRDQGKVKLLKFWVGRRGLRPPPPWAEVAATRLARAWAGRVDEGGNAEEGLNQDTASAAALAGKGWEQSRNVP